VPRPELYAGIDLGSNSFHMIVARLEHGQFRIIDRLKDMVRLAGGLDEQGRLDDDTRHRAIAALARFGERIRDIPDTQLRAVGTQTFRRLSNPAAFLVVAETALGCPIDIVSGREEARLVWLGVSQGVAPTEGRRLVIDIGGGSTELVAGESLQPSLAESLPLGCVSLTRWAFPDDHITPERYARALKRCHAELLTWSSQFRDHGWNQAVGTSGTIRAIASMIEAMSPGQDGRVTRKGLDALRDRLLEFPVSTEIDLDGLSARRQPVIAGGLVILDAVMQALELDQLRISPFALREGLLQDLLGRLVDRDPRDATVRGMMARYQIDQMQAERVTAWLNSAFEQVRESWALRPIHGELLAWIGQLHEVGLSIAHDGHQRHTAYILEHADMPGFSQQEQQFMAVVAGLQRRRLQAEQIDALPPRLHKTARKLIALLRLSVTMCRARAQSRVGDFGLQADGRTLTLALDSHWLDARPLLRYDLDIEREELQQIGLTLEVESPTGVATAGDGNA
jgi:exopolyphosphatase/guanosine-5'-triphosphate,3'-diphosphate pyrophosphatase